MHTILRTAFAALILMASSAQAEPVATGFFTNDTLGDGHDRWRSASYTQFLSYPGTRFGGMPYDIRIRGEIITPWEGAPQSGKADRLYASLLGFGAFVNQRLGITDLSLGGEITLIGDQTYLPKLQQSAHKFLGVDGYMPEERHDPHIANGVSGLVTAEAAPAYRIGGAGLVRPFAQGQVGYETFLRVGIDLACGSLARAGRYVRDPSTGFILPSDGMPGGFSLVAGVDYTSMKDSDLLPGDDVELEEGQLRARAGAQTRLGAASIFYGATYYSKEFKSQSEDQITGTISVQIPL